MAGALQRPRAVHDVAPGRGDPVAEDDRRPLPRRLAADRRALARDERPRLGRHQAERGDGLLEVVDRLEGRAGPRDVAVADDALAVDDEDRPLHVAAAGRVVQLGEPGQRPEPAGHPVALADREVLVGEQRHVEALLLGPVLVRVDRLRRDAEHLGVEPVDPVALVAVGAELLGADRGRVAGVEGEDHVAAAVVGEPVGLAAGAGQLEVRCRVAYVDLGHRARLDRQPFSIVIFSIRTVCFGFSVPGCRACRSVRPRRSPCSTLPTSAYSGGRPASARGDDEELAARAPGRLGRALRHRDDAFGVGEVGGRLLVDAVAGAAGAGAERVAALDHESGRDPVEGEVVVEAFVGEEDEGVDGLRRARRRRARSRTCRSWSRPPRSLLALGHRLLRRLEADRASASALRPACSPRRSPSWSSRCRRRCADQDRRDDARGDQREDGEGDPLPAFLPKALHRGESLDDRCDAARLR